MRTRLPLLVLTCLFLNACRRDDRIETYRVAKESRATPAGPAIAQKEIEWETPLGWKEQPASAMRTGSFLITGRNGQSAEVSIIPLSGEAGGTLANINRWRGQIKLPAISEPDLQRNSQTHTLAGRSMVFVNFVSIEPLRSDKRYRERVAAAIYERNKRTWFFKLMGEDQTVEEALPAFMNFLKSLRFHDSAS